MTDPAGLPHYGANRPSGAVVGVLDAPRRLTRQPTTIPRDHAIELVQQPRHSRYLPGPGWPLSRAAGAKRERDGPGAADLRTIIGNYPRRRLGLLGGDGSVLADSEVLGRNNVEPLLVGEAPDPPGATCAEASIPVEDQRGAFRPPIRKLAEIHTAF
jgi:hypothetical protein